MSLNSPQTASKLLPIKYRKYNPSKVKNGELFGGTNMKESSLQNWPCKIKLRSKYIIEYRWKSRDTRTPGHYKGKIKIEFMSDIYESGVTYEGGTYIGPIYEELDIFIKD